MRELIDTMALIVTHNQSSTATSMPDSYENKCRLRLQGSSVEYMLIVA